MTKDTVVAFREPEGFSPDPLTDLLHKGARELIAQAVEAELNAFLAAHADQTDSAGRKRLVRDGHLPERAVQTGIGALPVKVPRARDRALGGERLKFTSTILPPYLRRAKSNDELLPSLYLKGRSTGDFSEALVVLLGPEAPGLSASTITGLKADWWDDYERWCKCDLSARRYVYCWADSVHFSPRMDENCQFMLVILGADEWGNKDVLGLINGFRESTQSWRGPLLDLKRRGLEVAPQTCRGRRCHGVPGRPARGFWPDPHSAMLGSRDGKHAESDAQVGPAQSQGAPERHLDGRNQGYRRHRI
jgi:putative transposase